jgi:tetratricopeptide (TPR) repeat protein
MDSMVWPMLRTALALAAALAVPVPGLAAPPGTPGAPETSRPSADGGDVAALLEQADAAYTRRDDPAQLSILKARLAEAENLAPKDFGVLWRLARLNVWLADDPKLKGDEKSRLGKIAWDYGDKASAADPARVEGWYWSAAGMGMYGLGIGVITALRQGIEPKFKERLGKAEAIDAGYQQGSIQSAWGRFYFKLPWPKYDPRKAEEELHAALKRNPDNVRAHVYLGELLAKEDRTGEAEAEYRAALAKPPGRYDPPEERRWQEEAKRLLAGR